MSVHRVLIGGEWRESAASATFQAVNPKTEELLPDVYPVSRWSDVDAALECAAACADELRWMPGSRIAAFLEAYASLIEERKGPICEAAAAETALPLHPRLMDGELPRTVGQLRQAAQAARDGSWRRTVVDEANQLRSCRIAIGPVAVFGPNNFPLAFGSASGGDFAAAIAAGNPVLAKGHSCHPTTTRLFAEAAFDAAQQTGMPSGTVQLLYRLDHEDGKRLVGDARIGATGYTGSRSAGLVLKDAADAKGKPIYLELSSINPVAMLPGFLRSDLDQAVDDFVGSCLLGAGQFCTNPGLVLTMQGRETETWLESVAERFAKQEPGYLLSAGVLRQLHTHVELLIASGAKVVCGNQVLPGPGYRFANTLLRVDGREFLENSGALQTEAFGPASLVVVAADVDELLRLVETLEGNLTGTIYAAGDGSDDETARQLVARLRPKVGRLLDGKMPTGVAVSPAMNHGGPFPATGHPGFTAVGIPASIERFSQLACFDHVRSDWLPDFLRTA